MKKLFLIFLIMFSVSLTAFAAKYKINTSGKVTAPGGKTQNSSALSNTPNFYNNYYSGNYVSSKQVLSQKAGTIDIVMDYSGSMYYWINEAKNSMSAIVSQLPTSTKIGFRVFGHDGGNNPYTPVLAKVKSIAKGKNGNYKVTASTASYLGNTSGSCSATTQVAKVVPYNTSALLSGMNSVSIGGSTPMTLALKQAVEFDFAGLSTNYPKKIILITDGGENCGGDPCRFAANLVRQRKDIIVDVVLVSSNSTELRCLSDTTGGNFYTPSDLPSFTSSLIQSMNNAVQKEPQEVKQKYEFVD